MRKICLIIEFRLILNWKPTGFGGSFKTIFGNNFNDTALVYYSFISFVLIQKDHQHCLEAGMSQLTHQQALVLNLRLPPLPHLPLLPRQVSKSGWRLWAQRDTPTTGTQSLEVGNVLFVASSYHLPLLLVPPPCLAFMLSVMAFVPSATPSIIKQNKQNSKSTISTIPNAHICVCILPT